MNLKNLRWYLLTAVLLILLCPAVEKLGSTRQAALWTSHTWRRRELPLEDVVFSNRKGPVSADPLPWTRIRLGFPLRPVTIDYQPDRGIIQGRIELFYLIEFWGMVCLVALLAYAIGATLLKRRGMA